MRRWRRGVRLFVLALVALLPSFLKRPLYRLFFGYRIGPGVRVGLSLLDAASVSLGEGTTIGHFNLITRVGRLETGGSVRVGPFNIIRGGERVTLGVTYEDPRGYSIAVRGRHVGDHYAETENENLLPAYDLLDPRCRTPSRSGSGGLRPRGSHGPLCA